jgi:hypothetical protein
MRNLGSLYSILWAAGKCPMAVAGPFRSFSNSIAMVRSHRKLMGLDLDTWGARVPGAMIPTVELCWPQESTIWALIFKPYFKICSQTEKGTARLSRAREMSY